MKSFQKEMSLAGVKHPGKIQAIQWCNCRGKQHRVALINNCLVLLDHRLELELAMLDLGGEACGCMKVFLDICSRETERLTPSFRPYLEDMLQKKRKRQYGKISDDIRPLPRHIHRLIELLLRYRCVYPLNNHHTAITASCTGGSPFVKSGWLYRFEMGGEQYMTLQINVEKEWKKHVYDKGIAVVDDKLVLAMKGRNGSFGDMSVIVMDFDPNYGSFGTRNATIMKAHGKWRFKYMESQVNNYIIHHKFKGRAR